jgi:hypothetical protein
MESIRNRAKDSFPMVLLTLLSIVQALALEFLWDHVRHRSELFEWTLSALPGWIQIAASLNIIILIWLTYAGMLMRFRWTPTIGDSIFPFLVGLTQFAMIDLMGDKFFGLWVIVVSIAFSVMVLINHNAMKRARTDDANQEFFSRFTPATIRDFAPHIIMGSVMLGLGIWMMFGSANAWVRLIALILVFAVLVKETHNAKRYWSESMGEGQ